MNCSIIELLNCSAVHVQLGDASSHPDVYCRADVMGSLIAGGSAGPASD
jgi:hypothetical protein